MPSRRLPHIWVLILVSAVAACVVVLVSIRSKSARVSHAQHARPADRTRTRLMEIAAQLSELRGPSRALLLGSRDPNGPSCVPVPKGAALTRPASPPAGDPRGGIGMRVTALLHEELTSGKASPAGMYNWHQTWLRLALERALAENRKALTQAEALARKARALSEQFAGMAALSEDPVPVSIGGEEDWPGHCLASLSEALASRDLSLCRKWSAELAAATFALADLHRWADFLIENHLAAMAFQARCESLFQWVRQNPTPTFDPASLPGCSTTINAVHNYLEVERQAQRLFRVSPEYLAAINSGPDALGPAVWLPPDLRGAFLSLRWRLSGPNLRAWDQAAATPMERSYLANMLFRATRAGAVDAMGAVLARLDADHPRASITDLMDVIFYRGVDGFSAIDWADRYAPGLLDASAGLDGDQDDVLEAARKITSDLWGGWHNYLPSITLRQAMDTGRMGCTRATDMTNTLYRNAGRSGAFVVRWCSGVASHALAAAEVPHEGGSQVHIVDPLERSHPVPQAWPASYFDGEPWPTGFPGPSADVYAAELYGRGLDNYVWVEGYIVRGPNAGLLVRPGVPYLPGHQQQGAEKVFQGPYPQDPPLD